MKIGLIGFELTSSGGDQIHLLRLGRCLRKLGHEVIIYAYRFSPSFCHPTIAREFDIRAVHVLKDERLPVCRTTSLGVLSVAARRYFLESRHLQRYLGDVDVLNPVGRPAHRSAVFLKRKTGIPIVWICNDVVGWEEAGHRARVGRFIQRIASRAMLPREKEIVSEIDVITVLCERVRRVIETAYERPAHVVHIGSDSHSLAEHPEGGRRIREKFGVPEEAFLALWFGILEPFRRLEDLLQAMYILLQRGVLVHCLIVGRTDAARPYAARLKNLVSQFGLQKQVCFVEESIPEEELADYYSACDVFVFPNDQQSWGLAPLEALSCRRPVIVSRGSGVHEVLRDGETALLVPARHPEALANAIARIANDPALAQEIANRGKDLVAGLTWENYAASMLGLMEKVHFEAVRRSRSVRSTGATGGRWMQHMIAATEPVWRIR
ncbi:MAG: glycosyltransferase family 4 protein [Terriglobales bacterium]